MRNIFNMLVFFLLVGGADGAQEVDEQPADAVDTEKLYREFEESMSGVTLVGHFTVTGKDAPPTEERYTISSVKKLSQGDYWQFVARIRYGDKDVTLPLPLEVKWAETTPVITLTDLTIPGLGTFSSRVLIHDGKYAGTWAHGDVGGHLYGVIEKNENAELEGVAEE